MTYIMEIMASEMIKYTITIAVRILVMYVLLPRTAAGELLLPVQKVAITQQDARTVVGTTEQEAVAHLHQGAVLLVHRVVLQAVEVQKLHVLLQVLAEVVLLQEVVKLKKTLLIIHIEVAVPAVADTDKIT